MAKLYFHYSAMNAGKSIALLQVAHNYQETGKAVLMFTSQVDDRYGVGRITSRLGPAKEAETFDAHYDFREQLKDRCAGIACILVDEAQFLTKEQVLQLHFIAQCRDIPVMTYGIRSDAMGEPFEGAMYLLTLAETLEELKTICKCGKKATMNMRVTQAGEMVIEGEQVVIGGNDRYRSVCGKCFYKTRIGRIQALKKPWPHSF
jgi:thymidine kinase